MRGAMNTARPLAAFFSGAALVSYLLLILLIQISSSR